VTPENTIRVEAFSIDAFTEMVRVAGGGAVTDQVRYLAEYLDELGARTIVGESRYIDRHFMDEYALFYSRMLQPPANTVTRLHFFEKKFGDPELRGWMAEAFRGRKGILDTIRAQAGRYLGFTCVRPIHDSPIGRTVVERWPDGPKPRSIWAVGEHPVHIGNLEFDVTGLPFQQQEAAVGACATVAIWSALSRVARQEGMRAPTPAEIAEAVERPPRPFVRGLFTPTTGFTADQVCAAIQMFGFTPAVVGGDRPDLLALALHSYLQSRIPVVMILRGGSKGHAVTAVGFQLSGSDRPDLEPSVSTRSMQLQKIYVHDDRIGPYARATLTPFHIQNVDAIPDVQGLRFGIEHRGGKLEHWTLAMIVAPLYPKIRLSIGSLLGIATAMQKMVELAVGDDKFDLRVDLRYERSGEYLSSLTKRVQPALGVAMASRVALPRWCGIVRWSIGDRPLVEFVYDTTDIVRGDGTQQLLAIVALQSRMRKEADAMGARLGVPCA